ncbi:unnamed protein product [Gongylonema pulchrum]|uniref:Ribosome biogenesis protein NOP53 n=1 Tax=Gongylonema pulchrum TaxID=637853 RepID=A0A183E814_9BILA|nr:unnamed protein product [Gongylonema pulchrum]
MDSSKSIAAVEEHYLRTTGKKLPHEPKTLKHLTSVLPPVEVDSAGASYNPPISREGTVSSKSIVAVEEHYLRTTGKKLPHEPKTLKHLTSVLPPVEVDSAGASYNPPISSYLHYTAEIAEEEAKKMKEEEKIERSLVLAPGQTFITKHYAAEIAEEEAKKMKEEEKIERSLVLAPGQTFVTKITLLLLEIFCPRIFLFNYIQAQLISGEGIYASGSLTAAAAVAVAAAVAAVAVAVAAVAAAVAAVGSPPSSFA